MADATILTGDVSINYLANNRQKLMYWSGSPGETYTMNELYSAMATLLDETTTIDSGTAFSAETPVEYTTGKIDSGDTEPWYITFDLMEHITGGALRTSGWLHATDSNSGIVIIPGTNTDFVVGDVGETVTGAVSGSGTLLEVIEGAVDYLVVRPDDDASGTEFTVAQTVTGLISGHEFEQASVQTSGEMVWANLYSIGTIDSNVHQYLYQGEAADDADRNRVYSWNDATQDWYDNGHIDITVALKDVSATTWTTIDAAYLTVFARKYGDLYASFEVACSETAGGRNPIPLQTSADLDNTTGIKTVPTGAFSGTPALFTVGEIISEAVSLARGIVTSSVLDTSISYIPIDDPQIAFNSAGNQLITGATTGYTASSTGAEIAAGPAESTWFTSNTTPTATFGWNIFDVDDNGTPEDYAVIVDCKSNPLTEVYEWLKYATRNGEVTNDLDGINGERYIGGEVYLEYSGAVGGGGTIAEGEDVTQATTLASGIVISHDVTTKILLLRDARGTFNTTDLITGEGTGTITADVAAVTFAPKTASPLGTFAGGTFFGARGVLLFGWLSADENSFILTPIEGGTKQRPQAFIFEVTNLDGGAVTVDTNDRVSIFRLDTAAGNIEKDEYVAAGGESPGDPTLVVTGGITQDTPGKTTGGWLVLVDAPSATGAEYKIRYDSWDTSTFTLANVSGAFVTSGTNTNTLLEASAGQFLTTVERGDLVYNSTEDLAGYVKSVTDDTHLVLEGAGIVGNTTGDTCEFNCVPITVEASDEVYVPFMDRIATASEESVSVIYVSTVYYRVKVRNTRAAEPIKPYSSDGTVATSTSNQSIPTIRTEDTIITV